MTTPERLAAKYGNPHDVESFTARNIVTWPLPPAMAAVWPKFAGHIITRITINKAIIGPLCAVFLDLIDTGLVKELKTYDGAYNYRTQRGATALSMHAFGVALDFNAATNGLGKRVTFSPAFLDVWRKHGWTCGADFKAPRVDGMHFQYDKTP